MTRRDRDILKRWLLASRPIPEPPPKRHPIGARIEIHGKILHVVGHTENNAPLVSEIDPKIDYAGAILSGKPLLECWRDKLDSLKIS